MGAVLAITHSSLFMICLSGGEFGRRGLSQ